MTKEIPSRVTGNLTETIVLDHPHPGDGGALWRLARDSRTLDVNSPYSYLLWCRDHGATSVVARDGDGGACGFVTGYLRPSAPDTLFVWQVAVADDHRGRGLAGRMLAWLADGKPQGRFLEATVTPGNTASTRLFEAFARERGAVLRRSELFAAEDFPVPGHEPEVLFRIGPFPA
ncbi:diaminobutyrate acetyltransferase [Actinocorallia libanotica]|uniref:L-2,4-diaminobutyric acid acetyltransferase n=1 Tax=Actinocorallia libanotica TaxID=46162 RepID=A0ABN1R3S8_9ACTN